VKSQKNLVGYVQRYIDSFTPSKKFALAAASVIFSVISFDDDLADGENALFIKFCVNWGVELSEIDPLISMPAQQLLADVLSYTAATFNKEGKNRLAELSVVAALADEKFRQSELLLIELVIEALDVPHFVVDNVYREITGRALPSRQDPSTIEYYTNRQQSNSKQAESTVPPSSERERLLVILGLPNGATVAQVRTRFRELALTKHPDRAPHADEATKLRMHEEFLVIKKAYESLMVFYA
jgi:DnaJ like chaperone protein